MFRSLVLPAVAVLAVAVAPLTRPAHAADITEIASALDDEQAFDLHVGVDYTFENRRAAIKREAGGTPGTAEDAPLPIVKDLTFHQGKHIVTPRLALGVLRGLQLSAALPIVISDTRSLSLDQRSSPCIFPGSSGGRPPTCVDRDHSSTILDGFLPGAGGGVFGYDANDPEAGFRADSTMVFRGVKRSGFDQVHMGVTWAPLLEREDDTKPTWILGTEIRLSVGKIMRFNRLDPGAEDGVSRGVHEIRTYTGMSKRTAWAEPFVYFWWQAPFALRGTDPDSGDSSLFWDLGFGQGSKWPQQEAGTLFGFEAIPWENPVQQQRVSLELQARIEAHFEGRNYSEMWEVLSLAGDLSANPTSPLGIDADPTATTDAPLPYPGTTYIENYLTFGGRFAVRGQIGERARFSASFEIAHDQGHRITWTDAGKDGNDGDDFVTPGTDEVNPLHRPIIDQVGRRYLVDDSTIYAFMVSGTLMF